MKKRLFLSLTFVLAAALSVFAHDPRTTAKDFSHTMTIEGAGKLTLSFKSLHYNEASFNARKTERAMTTFNRLWKNIGKLDTDFDVVIGGVQVPKGSYSMGFNYDMNDNYKLVLGSGGKEIIAPLQVSMDGPSANFLTFDVRPEDGADGFTYEARYGKLRAWAEVKVPYLAPHDHPAEKPVEKKP